MSETRLAGLGREISKAFIGQDDTVQVLLWSLLAGGHVLLEGAPGLGKTTLVRALSASLDLDFRRVQFTPDLMPGDILGARILEESADQKRSFRFEPGPIFTQVLLADEINRATPRTQSALLEAMQERQVTSFGQTRPLPAPFLVIATQNPIEMEGTYPLPEAQLDRFLAKIQVPAPREADLIAILQGTCGGTQTWPSAQMHADELVALQAQVRELPASDSIVRRVAHLTMALDPTYPGCAPQIRESQRFGASPRGAQAVLMLAKARALCADRAWVQEDDLEAVLVPALAHRLVLSYEGEAAGTKPSRLIQAAWKAAVKSAPTP